MLLCSCCKKEVAKEDIIEVRDNYNMPYMYVCEDCVEETEAYIRQWTFDGLDAGEELY